MEPKASAPYGLRNLAEPLGKDGPRSGILQLQMGETRGFVRSAIRRCSSTGGGKFYHRLKTIVVIHTVEIVDVTPNIRAKDKLRINFADDHIIQGMNLFGFVIGHMRTRCRRGELRELLSSNKQVVTKKVIKMPRSSDDFRVETGRRRQGVKARVGVDEQDKQVRSKQEPHELPEKLNSVSGMTSSGGMGRNEARTAEGCVNIDNKQPGRAMDREEMLGRETKALVLRNQVRQTK